MRFCLAIRISLLLATCGTLHAFAGSAEEAAFLVAETYAETTRTRGRIHLGEQRDWLTRYLRPGGCSGLLHAAIRFVSPIPLPEFSTTLSTSSQQLNGLAAQFTGSLSSFRYMPLEPAVARNAEIDMLVLGGIGALKTSHAGVPSRWIRDMVHPESSVYRKVSAHLGHKGVPLVPIYAETFDWPMQGNFNGHWKDQNAVRVWGSREATLRTIGHLVADLSLPHLHRKRVVLGQSAGAAFAGGINAAFPSLVDGLILIGPVIPGTGGGAASEARFRELVEKQAFAPNWSSFLWASAQINEMRWADAANPFKNVPVLILIGENDPEVPDVTREWLEKQAQAFPNVEVHIIPGATHDVLSPWSRDSVKYSPEAAYELIHRFLRRVLDDVRN